MSKMRVFIPLVLLVTVFKSGCQASDGFGYEVLIEKMEYLDQKIEILQNKTIQQNSKIFQIINKIYQNMEPIGSCDQAYESGEYKLKVSNNIFEVYCEQELYGGGWIVIQNRFDGSVDFYRNWTEYRNGFGNLDGDFWLGLQKIYWLTSSRNYELLVHLKDFGGVVKYAQFNRFAIGSEAEQYKLKTLEAYSGTAGDSLSYLRNDTFSTYDQDNDVWSQNNCAKDRHGAWWYYHCSYSNLNGGYHHRDTPLKGMYWHSFKQYRELKISKMMIREV